MSARTKSLLSRAMTKQWSFLWAGITFGIAQIIYMVGLWVQKVEAGHAPSLKPITVTTDLGKMFRGLEVAFYNVFALPDFELYGKAIDGVAATGGAFIPGVGWPIVGMMIGGWLVTRAEKESRIWAHYPAKVLFVSFIGGMLFSYGTRLAGGCTLNHLLGGIPLLNIHSFITAFFMAIGGAMAFWVMSRTGIAPYFKHQETLRYAKNNDRGEAATYQAGYNGMKRPVFWLALAFSVAMFGTAIYGGLFNPESLQHLKNGSMIAFSKSLDAKGWFYVATTLLAGIVAGFGMAKSGFGTECSLVSMEVAQPMTNNDSRFAKLGVPRITRTLMRGYLPLIGIVASWVVMLGFIVVVWTLFDVGPAFSGALKYQTTVGNLIGGLLLGMGAVMLIGCEIRSYMRIGMGYLNTWVGFMGFAIGYLPFTLFYDAHKAFLQNTLLIETYKWYEFISPNSIAGQKLVLGLWWVALAGLLVFLVRLGARNTGASIGALLHHNTEDLEVELEAKGKNNGGRIGDVTVPQPVPAAIVAAE